MDLLNDKWISVRPLHGGSPQIITLQTLLCGSQSWVLCLPRDDMELAALQLLICLVQVILPVQDYLVLRQRLSNPLSESLFTDAVSGWNEVFQLNHPDAPFMQTKGVAAKEATGMDKLLVGLTGATNCAFVNEPGQGNALCGGCTAIALFNQANNAPGFGGGFKSGLRGGSPVTTLVQGNDLRTTVWLNVLTTQHLEIFLDSELPQNDRFVWQDPIKSGEKIPAASIGLFRGLFWQPAHIELCPTIAGGICSGCGQNAEQRYDGFLKEKFSFNVEEIWPHPHSPRLLQTRKGQPEEKFLSFTTSIPSWTQVSRILVEKAAAKNVEGHRVAAVVKQAQELLRGQRLQLIIGGYRTNQASILERRHDVLVFNQGWQQFLDLVNEIVETGLNYKTALRKALYTFSVGVNTSGIKGAGVAVHESAERHYYRQSELIIPDLLASLEYENADNALEHLRRNLHQVCERLFEDATAPYIHHPKLALTLAVARRSLYKHLGALQPEGGNNNVD
ncbi:type I-E CRISPR-associated protein Cse1/CasA [Citrobacter sp. TSA-1]|uniref:type I-E CRISPR-associated protein Cse1/CasA n=1 Tax=Citrobacter sp. TSA-1 TaxID=184912 RepID=UPI000BADDD92|nr:type I-E CRISPR-associated protein Cse1/CasA [Citrobacter sp. TSA-1]PAX78406.1 type I-E CRISPR-associated protein Cse1/CasA [Citrobacter sp. TSA-1]QKE19037.1 type I-E CRISPR-associated protein Cse1/CasA [Citrobacter sp. TSA-1]